MPNSPFLEILFLDISQLVESAMPTPCPSLLLTVLSFIIVLSEFTSTCIPQYLLVILLSDMMLFGEDCNQMPYPEPAISPNSKMVLFAISLFSLFEKRRMLSIPLSVIILPNILLFDEDSI